MWLSKDGAGDGARHPGHGTQSIARHGGAPYTRNPTPFILNPEPYILHPAPNTLHPTP